MTQYEAAVSDCSVAMDSKYPHVPHVGVALKNVENRVPGNLKLDHASSCSQSAILGRSSPVFGQIHDNGPPRCSRSS